VPPAQTGVLLERVGVAGVVFTTTETVENADVHPPEVIATL
jgi:hypothetical protein